MTLAELTKLVNLDIRPGEQWAIIGPEAADFSARLKLTDLLDKVTPAIDGLLLAGQLSAITKPFDWLRQMVHWLKPGAKLIIIDWQYEAADRIGPDLERRIRGGKLCRWLRSTGFGMIDRQSSHPHCYIIRAVKGPALIDPYAGQYTVVARLDELSKNTMKPVELFGHKVIVANTGREIVAFDRACPHAHQPLDRGILRGRNLVCRAHAYMWNVVSGEPLEPEDEDVLPLYPVKIDQVSGEILVALPGPLTD